MEPIQENPSDRHANRVLETRLVINNQPRQTSNGATFERANPISGEIVSRAPAATAEDAVAAVEAAEKAFPSWSRLVRTSVGASS